MTKTQARPTLPPGGELLYGVAAIAAFLGISHRQALYLTEKGSLPHWKEGRTIVARRETLRQWIAAKEAAGRGAMVKHQVAGAHC